MTSAAGGRGREHARVPRAYRIVPAGMLSLALLAAALPVTTHAAAAGRVDGGDVAPAPASMQAPTHAPAAGPPQAPSGDPALAAIAARLARPPTLRGRFKQEKRLAGFRNPVRSSGEFLLVRGRGVAWDTTAPFASSAVLTPAALSTSLPDGDTRVVVDAAASPAAATVTGLFLALVAGDVATLAERFDVDATAPAGDGPWTLVLRPRDDALAKSIAGITLSGRAFVEDVQVRETAGDATTLHFSDLRTAPAADAAERARFD